jgi:glutathione S-transferase
MVKVYAFRWVPPFAQGLVRDLRVRWALEEAGKPYEARLIGREDQTSADYRRKQPFGQVPVYEEEGLTLFESGEIVLHVAEQSDVLLPRDSKGRARARSWMFAALNTIEPYIANLTNIDLFDSDKEWAKLRRPEALELATKRLQQLSAWLGDKEYLEDRFTAGDLLMTTVLRIPRHIDLVKQMPNLDAYRQRCEARPAFGRALAAQLRNFEENAPPPAA